MSGACSTSGEEEEKTARRTLVRKPGVKRPVGTPRSSCVI
jgi:hypothetical protein